MTFCQSAVNRHVFANAIAVADADAADMLATFQVLSSATDDGSFRDLVIVPQATSLLNDCAGRKRTVVTLYHAIFDYTKWSDVNIPPDFR